MRILHLVHQYPPEYIGGVELYTHTVAHYQARLGHTVTVVTGSSAEDGGHHRQVEDGVEVIALHNGVADPRGRFLATLSNDAAAVAALIHARQPDLIHVQHLMGLPAALLGSIRAAGIPYLITLHDYWWICANAQLLTNYSQTRCDGPIAYLNCTRCLIARSGQPYLWAAAPVPWGLLVQRARLLGNWVANAGALVAPSEFVRSWYERHGAPAGRTIVVPHGVDPPDAWTPRPRAEATKVRFLYLGGIAPQKGVHIALDAFRRVRGAAEFHVAGDLGVDPPYAKQLQALAPPNVRFLGRLDRVTLWDALSAADILVTPSLWHETFCFVVHEAFAAGIPVMAARIGALQDVVRDGIDGILLPPGAPDRWATAMQALVDDPAQIKAMRGQGRRPISVASHMEQLEHIYAGVLAGTHGKNHE